MHLKYYLKTFHNINKRKNRIYDKSLIFYLNLRYKCGKLRYVMHRHFKSIKNNNKKKNTGHIQL